MNALDEGFIALAHLHELYGNNEYLERLGDALSYAYRLELKHENCENKKKCSHLAGLPVKNFGN